MWPQNPSHSSAPGSHYQLIIVDTQIKNDLSSLALAWLLASPCALWVGRKIWCVCIYLLTSTGSWGWRRVTRCVKPGTFLCGWACSFHVFLESPKSRLQVGQQGSKGDSNTALGLLGFSVLGGAFVKKWACGLAVSGMKQCYSHALDKYEM